MDVTDVPEVEIAVTGTVTDIDDIEQYAKAEFVIYTLYKSGQANPNGRDCFDVVTRTENIFIPNIEVELMTEDVLGGWSTSTKVNDVTGEILTVFRNTVNVAQELFVSAFPYDTQAINFTFICSNASLVTWKSDPALVKDYSADFVKQVREWDETDVHFFRSIAPNWRLEEIKIFERKMEEEDKFPFPGRISFKLWHKRDPGYFSINYSFTIFIVVATNLSVVGVPVADIGERMAIIVTLLLTLVALKLVLADISPRSSSPTYMDVMVFTGFVLMFFIAMEVGITRIVSEGLVIVRGVSEEYEEEDEEDINVALGIIDAAFHILVFVFWVGFYACHSCGGYCCDCCKLSRLFALKRNSKFIGYQPNTDEKPTQIGRYIKNAGNALQAVATREGRRGIMRGIKTRAEKKVEEIKESISSMNP